MKKAFVFFKGTLIAALLMPAISFAQDSRAIGAPAPLESELVEALVPSVTLFQHFRFWLSRTEGDASGQQRDETFRQFRRDLARFGLQPNSLEACRASLNFLDAPRAEEAHRATGRFSINDPCYPKRLPPGVRDPLGMEFDEQLPEIDSEGRRPPVMNHGGGTNGGGAGRRGN